MSEAKEITTDDTSSLADADERALAFSRAFEVSGYYSRNAHGAKVAGASEGLAEGDGIDAELDEQLASPESSEALAPGELDAGDEESTQLLLKEVAAAGLTPPLGLIPVDLRLDVDGPYPQLAASGTFARPGNPSSHWIARLKPAGRRRWIGSIWYQNPTAPALPYTAVVIRATRTVYRGRRRARVDFVGAGVRTLGVIYGWQSRYFHPFEFEVDRTSDAERVLQINTGAHPDRPASLPTEILTVREVYQRAGFDAVRRAGNVIDPADAGTNGTWSDAEMHDAMQVHWRRFANAPQWRLWVLFARQHDIGSGLGGIMFDDIGPNHRQGTAIFTDSFISEAPAGDPAPVAWAQRMRFWTAVHEMGHAFNLAHSWQKELGTAWIPTPNEPEARSFMNYPFGVLGGVPAFFGSFEFRFSDSELLFMRHAPEAFVQMGNADWFDNHGFQEVARPQRSGLRLSVGVNRPKAYFDFLEPIVLELRLNNPSLRSVTVDRNALLTADSLTVVVKKRNAPARRLRPFAHYCKNPSPVELRPKGELAGSLFVSAGAGGWEISEPGEYLVQVALHLPTEDIVSAPLRLRVGLPKDQQEDVVAQDYFSDEVGRAIGFDGTRVLDAANDVLRRVTEVFPEHSAARHARIALALPLAKPYRTLRDEACFYAHSPDLQEAAALAQQALAEAPARAAESLGLVDYAYYADRFTALLAQGGDSAAAQRIATARHSVTDIASEVDTGVTPTRGSTRKVEAAE